MAPEHPLMKGSTLVGGGGGGGGSGRGLAGAVRTVLSVTFLLRRLEENRSEKMTALSLCGGQKSDYLHSK